MKEKYLEDAHPDLLGGHDSLRYSGREGDQLNRHQLSFRLFHLSFIASVCVEAFPPGNSRTVKLVMPHIFILLEAFIHSADAY